MQRVRIFVFMVMIMALVLGGCESEAKDSGKEGEKGGFSQKDLNVQSILALNWYQTSAEVRALYYQAFNMARLALDKNTQGVDKPAVVVDIDETILDNSPYQARLIGKNEGYNTKSWNAWCTEADAKAVPGALSFLKYADKKGVTIFYLSNRSEDVREATIKNLKKLGFPQVRDEQVLLKTETSNKDARRARVKENYKIVLLAGDNLNDFNNLTADKSIEERIAATDRMKDKFGTQFIVLPNPTYGEWEGAIYNYKWGKSPAEKNEARRESLVR